MTPLERLYARLPLPAQHLATTLQGARYYVERYGSVFRAKLAELRRTEFSSALELAGMQWLELRRTLRFAFERVPYYREMARASGLDYRDLRSPEDLRKLPITTKDDIRRQPAAFLADGMPQSGLIRWRTSGTTGSPLTLWYTREAVGRQYAFVELYRNQAGVDRHTRRGQFTGRMIVPPGQPASQHVFWRRDLANRALLLSTVHLSEENLPDYAAALERFGPRCLTGYPSALSLLARHYLATGRPAPRLRAVLTSAETLLAPQRTAIEQAFATRVYDQYGQTEMQSFWYECGRGRMHAHPLAGFTEIVAADHGPAAAGEAGEVVLTGFLNAAMPLVRYRVGDRARASAESCECGRNMPVIAAIAGRLDDYVWSSERGLVGRLDPAFKGLEHIAESQIVQESADRIVVRYVPEPGFDSSELGRLEANLRQRLGTRISIDFTALDRIPREPNGKFRAVISRLGGRS